MFLLFKFGLIILLRENYALKETLNKKNLKFVENLRHDLRRNNDDYAEIARRFSQTNNTQESLDSIKLNDIRYKIITTRDNTKVTNKDQRNNNIYVTPLKITTQQENNNDKDDVRFKIVENIRRRVNDALISKEVTNNDNFEPQRTIGNDHKAPNNDGTSPNIFISTLQKKNHNLQHRIRLLSNKTNPNELSLLFTLRPTPTVKLKKEKKKRVKKSKIEKFKKFMEKNKGLLREFIEGKNQASSMSMTTPTPITFNLNKILRQDLTGFHHKKFMEELPNGAMLDMFPAKGGRIHSKRVKGHLCHRHVLIPEGPKYNSQGRIYLPPHAAARIAHEYNATDTPKLLLPRCCNCCHKSVLGCE